MPFNGPGEDTMTAEEADADGCDAEQSLDAALKAERAQFELAERAASFGYWRLTLGDNRATWSPGMYRLLAVDPSVEANNDWLLEQVADEDAINVRELVAAAIRARSPFQYITHSKYPDAIAQVV